MITNHIIKHGIKIGNATVYSNDFLGKGKVWTGAKNELKYITIHNTGVIDTGALNFHKSQKQNNKGTGRDASWHLTVDSKSIYQHNPIDWRAWHCGSGNTPSFGIEICMSSDATIQKQIYENSIQLVAMLMKHYNIPMERVVQHHHWTQKDCPQYLRANKFGYNWNWFKNKVNEYLTKSEPSVEQPSKTQTGTIEVLTNNLNVRLGDGTSYKVVKQIHKGETYKVFGTKNGWYNLGGTQWVSGDSKYVKFTELKIEGYKVGDYNKDVIVTAEPSLSVRNGRGTTFSKIGSFKTGTKVNVWYIGKDNNGELWGSCSYQGKTGYIHMGYTKPLN